MEGSTPLSRPHSPSLTDYGGPSLLLTESLPLRSCLFLYLIFGRIGEVGPKQGKGLRGPPSSLTSWTTDEEGEHRPLYHVVPTSPDPPQYR